MPLQPPVRKSTTASKPEEPTTVISCVVSVATKEYQTSSLAVPVAPAHVIAAIDCVAPATSPAVVPPQVVP